jgi:hypothetical protein
MPSPGDQTCISGSQYVWTQGVPPSFPGAGDGGAGGGGVPTTDINTQLSDIIDTINVIAARMPGGAAASTSYRYVEIIVDARRNDYLITIGVPARNFNMRFDQPIKIRLGSVVNDQIYIDPTESPFEVLNFAIDIDEIYVTSYANQTNLKILAW